MRKYCCHFSRVPVTHTQYRLLHKCQCRAVGGFRPRHLLLFHSILLPRFHQRNACQVFCIVYARSSHSFLSQLSHDALAFTFFVSGNSGSSLPSVNCFYRPLVFFMYFYQLVVQPDYCFEARNDSQLDLQFTFESKVLIYINSLIVLLAVSHSTF